MLLWKTKELIVNLDQIPLSYVSPSKYFFDVKGVKTVLLKLSTTNVREMPHLLLQCLKNLFPFKLFMRAKQQDVYLSSIFLRISTLNFLKIIGPIRKRLLGFSKKLFPHFKNVHQTNGYSNEKMSLVTMDTFKGQANEAVAKLCCENSCVLILVPHNLTNKFQALDVIFNKPAKSFIKEKYNI